MELLITLIFLSPLVFVGICVERDLMELRKKYRQQTLDEPDEDP